jgi:hypothetical protein
MPFSSMYYRIWMDCITRIKSREANKENWRIKTMLIMSSAMAFNLTFLMAILQRNILESYFFKLKLPFLSNTENNMLTYIVLFLLPCVVLNYLLIFRGNRYEKLLGKYPYYDGKLCITYVLGSLFVPVFFLFAMFLYQLNSSL